jgi:hypothetical protein
MNYPLIILELGLICHYIPEWNIDRLLHFYSYRFFLLVDLAFYLKYQLKPDEVFLILN